MNTKKSLLAILCSVALATPAFAQGEGEGEGEDDLSGVLDSSPGDDAEAEGGDAAELVAAEDAPKKVRDENAPFARIADDQETIYSVQRKAYLVNGKFELTPLASASFTDRFVQTFAPAASVTYHAAENFGFELYGGYMFPTESGLTVEILQKGKLTPETAKLTQMLWAAGVGVQWSPIYGKLQLMGASLGNFSFYVGAGIGVGQTRVRCTPGTMLDPNAFPNQNCPDAPPLMGDTFEEVYEPATFKVMGALSGGVRFYFSNWVGLKFEIKDYIFTSRVFRPETQEATQRYTDAVRNNMYAQLGVSFLLGGEDD